MLAAAILATVAAIGSAHAAPFRYGRITAPQTRTLTLTPAEMFKLAELADSRGNSAMASSIYVALERNPDADVRAEARFRHAKQLISQNQSREAALLLRRVLDDKPDAAPVRLELAHVLQVLGDSDAALRELRAAQATGLPPAVARLVDRYSQALRAARPVGASIEVAIAPDSNINHATRSDTLGTILGDFDIDDDSKAKSGLGLSLRGQAYRRFALGNGDNSLLVRASGFADIYGKPSFNDIAAELAFGPELRLGRSRLNVEIAAGQQWYGQEPFIRSARLGATLTRPIGRRMQVRLTGTASLIDNKLNSFQDGKGYAGRIQLERALTETTGLALNFSLDRENLKDPGYSTTGWRTELVGWKDVGRSTFTAEAEIGRLKADERLVLFPDKRQDRYSRFALGATFRQLTFRGFAPVARFTIERNRSSVGFYDYKRTRSELAVVRAF